MYSVIYADPPWRQSKGGKKNVRPKSSGEELDYPVLSLDEIEEILCRFRDESEDNHVLFMWTIDKYLFEAEEISKRLGYKLHARMIWNKVTGIPAAFTVRFGHEYLLWFYKGKLLPIERGMRGKVHTVFTEKVRRHSQKPEEAYRIIESFYPEAEKIELFARNLRGGWASWGNEV